MIESALSGVLDGIAPPEMQIASASDAPPGERSYWVVPHRLLAGAYPGHPDAAQHQQRIESLWLAGIRTFINLVEVDERNNSGLPFADYEAVLKKMAAKSHPSVQCLRFPVRDLSVPTIAEMTKALDAIDHSLALSRPVYVHCFGGVGRTGVVVSCWLLRHNLATPDNVFDVLAELRRADRLTAGRPAPETGEQRRFVTTWKC